LEEALSHFSQATAFVDLTSSSHEEKRGEKKGGSVRIAEEIFSNYATALRKSDRLEDALSWYHRCLSLSPSDPNTHASIAFTLHLLKRFDSAISAYHKALALQPAFTFCIEMLNRAMADACSGSNPSWGPSPSSNYGSNFNSNFNSNFDSSLTDWASDPSFNLNQDPDESMGQSPEVDIGGLNFLLGETDTLFPP
jgi:tetratricopeptide (TPR) repeat protein